MPQSFSIATEEHSREHGPILRQSAVTLMLDAEAGPQLHLSLLLASPQAVTFGLVELAAA